MPGSRRRVRRFVAGTPFLLLGSCGLLVSILAACRGGPRAASQAGADSLQAELERAVVQYYQDMSARNWQAYAAHFWPQATLTTVWQPPGEPAPRVVITSIETFLAQTAQGPDSKPIFEERLLSQESRISGNLAQVWAHYAARFGDSTNVATWRGIDAFTWMKHNGQWRIVALAYIDEPDSKRGAP